jgi:hypothetical protein
MLLVRSRNVTTLISLQSILPSADFKVEAAVFASDHRLPAFGIFVINNCDPRMRERIPSGRADYNSCDPKRRGCSLGLRRGRILCRQERNRMKKQQTAD